MKGLTLGYLLSCVPVVVGIIYSVVARRRFAQRRRREQTVEEILMEAYKKARQWEKDNPGVRGDMLLAWMLGQMSAEIRTIPPLIRDVSGTLRTWFPIVIAILLAMIGLIITGDLTIIGRLPGP